MHITTMHIRNAIILFLFQCSFSLCCAQVEEPAERKTILDEAAQAYRIGDVESLIRQHEKYSDFLTQRTASGASKMKLFFDGIANAKRDATESQLAADIARTLAWSKNHMDVPLTHVLHAAALQSYGGYFRGDGFANSVPPQAWKVYEDYTKRAGQYLIANEEVSRKSSTWFMWMLNIARTADWPPEVVLRLFDDGLKVNRDDYSLYINTEEYFLPKWHGNAQALDRFIRYAVTKAPPEYGAEMYARLYSGAGESQFERRLYTDSLVDWSLMRDGLEVWYKHFPTAWNLNIVAYHACIAGDKTLAKKLFDEINGEPEWTIWQPRAQTTFDTCTRWAADPDADPKSPRKAVDTEGRQSLRQTAPGAA